MKLLTGNQIREWDSYTIEHEPITSLDLMERAATCVAEAIAARWTTATPMMLFAGPGNNGGDALAVARILASRGYQVSAYLFNVHGHLSDNCATNKRRLMDTSFKREFKEITLNFDPPKLTADTVVIDGLFGTGLNKPLSGGFASLVKYVNQSPCKVVSIDMPSGLMTEDNTYNIRNNIIQADLTLTFGQKKLSMLFADTQIFLGEVQVLNIGLQSGFLDTIDTGYELLDAQMVKALFHPRDPFAHKGLMGKAMIVAGSYGMAGAAVLTTKACLRAGAGKVITHSARKNLFILQTSVPEAMVHPDKDDNIVSDSVDVTDYDAVAIGPGLGIHEDTAVAVIGQIRRSQCPVVVDADALNIIGNHRAWMQQLPKDIIMTPHPKEFDNIAGSNSGSDYERLSKARELAERHHAYILLKGHYTALCTPQGKVLFNTTGNAGMATAGSGDVLTGIITGLLARSHTPYEAAALGMYLHGLAGDLAVQHISEESLMARDIINYLSGAFKQLKES